MSVSNAAHNPTTVAKTTVTEKPPQFGLKGLLLAMTWLSVSLAVFTAIGPIWSAFVLLFGLLIAAHVLGNALGTRLTESASQNDRPTLNELPLAPPTAAVAEICNGDNRMHHRTKLDRPWLIAAAVGAALGGILGGGVLALTLGAKLSVAGMGLGIGSSAVIGGLLGFMGCSLYCVARQALREALECLDEPRKPT